jgi:succinate dehydrogenase / fumarate reductase cytochrome b subunit
VIGWGPKAYDRVLSVYHNPGVRVLEWILVGMVIYHAVNGVRVILLDFWSKSILYHRQLSWATAAVVVGAMIPISIVMWRDIVDLLVH